MDPRAGRSTSWHIASGIWWWTVPCNGSGEAGGKGKPIDYVMLEAAVSSEVFLPSYNPLAAAQGDSGVRDLVEHAQRLGFPDPDAGRLTPDWPWLEQEKQVFRKVREFPREYACRSKPSEVLLNPYPSATTRRCYFNARWGKGGQNPDGWVQVPGRHCLLTQ